MEYLEPGKNSMDGKSFVIAITAIRENSADFLDPFFVNPAEPNFQQLRFR
jgi:hypothetical protein